MPGTYGNAAIMVTLVGIFDIACGGWWTRGSGGSIARENESAANTTYLRESIIEAEGGYIYTYILLIIRYSSR